MAGALIVEPADPSAYLPPELAAMGDGEVLVLQHLCFYTQGVYRAPNPYMNHMMVSNYSGDKLRPNPSYVRCAVCGVRCAVCGVRCAVRVASATL